MNDWPKPSTVLAIAVVVFFIVVAAMIVVRMWQAVRDANRFERAGMELMRRGLCPYCGQSIQEHMATNCPHCGNWIDGWRRATR